MQRRRWRLIGIGLALGVSAVVLLGCSSTEAKAPSASVVAAELSRPQAQSSSGAAAARGTTRTSEGGSVTIKVTWQNPGDTDRPLAFSVAMDTHSVNLDGYDLGKLAVLRNDRGQELKPERWDAPSGGHHRSGTLSFPAKDTSGKAILASGVRVLELVIRDVAGVKERVFRWEVS
ncbi:MAG: hypothetical protein ACM3US_08020 [Sphingomonadaceae bacterium]